MATGPGVNQGKTAFVQEQLRKDRTANPEAINRAWAGAGHEGEISASLVGKTRQRLGLTGKRGARPGRPKKVAGATAEVSPKGARAERAAGPVALASPTNGRRHRGRVLDEIEGDIDRLIFKLKAVGGMDQIEDELRRVRRRLVRSHGE
jgi:hypothetical protein